MKLGTNDISSVYLGTNAVQKVYLGTNEVWSNYAYLAAAAYKARVLADGGTYENGGCLAAFLNTLSPYSGNLLLGLYPNAAAAYSLRLLNPDYTGDAIRVRRSSDNTEQDIGFLSGALDTASLLTFCGVGNGFVVTWYDQSGNARHLLQTTAASQPRIVNAGSLDVVNGKAAILGDGVDDRIFSSIVGLSNPNTGFYVIDKIGNSKTVGGLFSGAAFAGGLLQAATGVYAYQQGPQFGPTYANVNQSLITLKTATTGANWAMWGNGSAITNSGENIGTSTGNTINFFSQISANFGNAYVQEYILYSSDKTSDRVGLETNINSYYGIY